MLILEAKRAGEPARRTAERVNATGGNPTTVAGVRDVRRKWAKFEPDLAAIEAQMRASCANWYKGRTRQHSDEARKALAKRVVEMTDGGMARAEIAAALGTSYSHIAYLRRYAAKIGLAGAPPPKKQYPTESHAKPESDRQYEAKMRRCLVHGGPFKSSWPGERVCKRCRGSERYRGYTLG